MWWPDLVKIPNKAYPTVITKRKTTLDSVVLNMHKDRLVITGMSWIAWLLKIDWLIKSESEMNVISQW